MTPADRLYLALLCERVIEDPVAWEYGGPSEAEQALAAATLARLDVNRDELAGFARGLDAAELARET